MEVFDTAQEYQKPIVTPFEVGMALDFGSVWTGNINIFEKPKRKKIVIYFDLFQ